jgi:hypothetical protein
MNLDDVIAVIPLLQFSIIKLRIFAALAEKESPEVPHGSRLIYTHEKLQVYSLVCLNCGTLDVYYVGNIYYFFLLCWCLF